MHVSENHTWDGVIIGSFVFGALGLWWTSELCGLSDGSCDGAATVGILGGVTMGAVVGGMIGSGKKRPPKPAPRDSTVAPAPLGERALEPPIPVHADSALFPRAPTHGGNGAALGAAIGGGSFAVVMTLFCGPRQNCALRALKYGAIGAGVGGLVGAWASASVQSSAMAE